MNDVVVRECRSDDVPAVLHLWASSGAERSVTDDAGSLRQALAHPTTTVLVADEGERLVGSLIVAWDGWRGTLYRLVVVPERRRERIASRLVDAAEHRLRGAGAARIALVVVDDDAAGFWRAAGYALHPSARRFTKDVRVTS